MSDSQPQLRLSDVKTHSDAFDVLKTLVGSWEGTTDRGRLLRVTYTLHAMNSVLLEAWTLGPKSDALTLYHMDVEILMATHYCPLCNQPRLLLSTAESPDRLVFSYGSATNLPDVSAAHQHSFEFRLLGADSFWRSETYVESGVPDSEGVTYHRVRGSHAL